MKEVFFFSNSFRMKFSILVHCDIKMFLPQFFRLFGIIFCSKNHWTSRGHRCSQKWTGYFGLQSRGGSNANYNLVQRWGIGCNRSHRQISKFLDSFYYISYVRHYNPLLNTSTAFPENPSLKTKKWSSKGYRFSQNAWTKNYEDFCPTL